MARTALNGPSLSANGQIQTAHDAAIGCAKSLSGISAIQEAHNVGLHDKRHAKLFAKTFLELKIALDSAATIKADDWLPFQRATNSKVRCLGEVAASWHEVALLVAKDTARNIGATALIVEYDAAASIGHQLEPLNIADCIEKNFGVPHRANFTGLFAGKSFDPDDLVAEVQAEYARVPVTEDKQIGDAKRADNGGARVPKSKLFPKGEPKKRDLVEFVQALDIERSSGKSDNQIAREYTNGDCEKATKLLTRYRRARNDGKVGI